MSYEIEPPPGAQPPPGGKPRPPPLCHVAPPLSRDPAGRCWVPEQKETPRGLRDEACGREAPPGQAGLCWSVPVGHLGGVGGS